MYVQLALLAGFILLYSVVAGRIERSWISGPMVFTAFGLAAGPMGLGWLELSVDAETMRTLAELTLALVLFSDAAAADLGVLRQVSKVPIRLLLVGLPLTILFGVGVGEVLFPDFSFFEIAILATMLAPTDAALGAAVVTNEAVPAETREGLDVESGLNDGICVPILFLFLALALGQEGHQAPGQLALKLVAEEVGIGAATGVAITLFGVWILRASKREGWLSAIWMQVPVIGIAFCSFAVAQALGGSGFIASFVGGLLFGGLLTQYRDELLGAAEGTGNVFSILTWVLFGSAVVGQAAGHFDWTMVAYALASLTVVRMLPVFMSISGTGISTEGKLFIGWFGPRGLASIVFAIIVVDTTIAHRSALATVVVCTVVLSVVLHGVTANPWVSGYGSRHSSGGA